MKNVIFYMLHKNIINGDMTYIENFTYNLIINKWRENKRILIVCKDNIQALKIDKALWVLDSQSFVPHNLIAKNLYSKAPVEICWSGYNDNITRDLVINFLPHLTNFISLFCEVVDFVPNEIHLRKLARDRYKVYRNMGFQIIVIDNAINNI